MATGFLHTKGDIIVDENDDPVVLRGAAIGGWMNMENFITGYPGHEHQHRAAMLKVLGKEKYEFFFDKWLEYFFTEKDAEFFQKTGLNCLRLPFNYRHFEDDMNPRVLKTSGFKHLDRVVDLCAKHHIYTIIDMHTVPGGQNPDWHADNPTAYAAFWDYKDHQDRAIWLWQRLAEHYKDNAWVAGYNPLNEPCDPQHVRLPAFYARLEPAIREIDDKHILFLDGNTFAAEWIGFEKALPNSVYSMHDYNMMGFPSGERYKGTDYQKKRIENAFLRKATFMTSHGCPIWNGEFGPVYADPVLDADTHEVINAERFNLLGAQLDVYDKYGISWSIWLYKDIGVQGMTHTSRESAWNTLIQPFLDKKRRLQLDAWGCHPSAEADAVMSPLVAWIDKVSPTATDTYPTFWPTARHVSRAIMQTFLSNSLSAEFAQLFAGKSFEELDSLAHSFHFDECVPRKGLNDILMQHASKIKSSTQKVPVWTCELERKLVGENLGIESGQ